MQQPRPYRPSGAGVAWCAAHALLLLNFLLALLRWAAVAPAIAGHGAAWHLDSADLHHHLHDAARSLLQVGPPLRLHRALLPQELRHARGGVGLLCTAAATGTVLPYHEPADEAAAQHKAGYDDRGAVLVMMRALSSMAPDSSKGDPDLAVQQAAAAVAVVQRQPGQQQRSVSRGESGGAGGGAGSG
jgi:hypothetical protein